MDSHPLSSIKHRSIEIPQTISTTTWEWIHTLHTLPWSSSVHQPKQSTGTTRCVEVNKKRLNNNTCLHGRLNL